MKTGTTRSGIRMDLIRGLEDVARLLTEPGLRKEMGRAGLKRTHENYAYEIIAPKLVDTVNPTSEPPDCFPPSIDPGSIMRTKWQST